MAFKKWNWAIIWALLIQWDLYSSCRELTCTMLASSVLEEGIHLWHTCSVQIPWILHRRMTEWLPWWYSGPCSKGIFPRQREAFLLSEKKKKKCYKQLSSALILRELLRAPSASLWTSSACSLCILMALHWTSSSLLTSLVLGCPKQDIAHKMYRK